MLTTLHLEGFKAIADRQRIELAPLTLLVGHDGAGKSTILHALLYLHELLEGGAVDVRRTERGGGLLDLGDFARLAHRCDTSHAIVVRAELTTPGSLERFARAGASFPFPNLDDQVESAWVELTVGMRSTSDPPGPRVERVSIGAGSSPEPLVWLEMEGERLYARVNLGHPLLAHAAGEVADAWEAVAVPEAELPRCERLGLPGDRPLPVFALSRSRLSALPSPYEPLHVIPWGGSRGHDASVIHEVRTLLEMVVLGTTAQLSMALREALYVGSLRTIPTRDFLYECPGRTTSWANGLAAWDRLLTDRSTLVERTNDWLRRLGTGCQVVVQPLLDASNGSTTRRVRLDTGTGSLALPSEVGAGVSQLLPVLVAALEARAGLSLIEQPELHVHPAIQVGLGDLFIEAATRHGGRRMMLVETHSEHLILRLLRRIRQTSEGELPVGALPLSPEQLSVLHVENHSSGMQVRRLRVDDGGDFQDRWPHGFFAERRAELL